MNYPFLRPTHPTLPPPKSLIRPEAALACESRRGFEVFEEHDAFHVGPDGRMHFTDTHTRVAGLGDDFCVDQLHEEVGQGPGQGISDRCGADDYVYPYPYDYDYSYDYEANDTYGFRGDTTNLTGDYYGSKDNDFFHNTVQ